jgi:hypothetical protein
MAKPMKYRIVKDGYCGFEAQFRPRWWPFWLQCYGINTNTSVEIARRVCDKHARGFAPRLVEHYEPNEQVRRDSAAPERTL